MYICGFIILTTCTHVPAVRRETYAALNVPVVDAKLQGRVLVSLRASLELVTSFATQLSTLHSYLQQVRHNISLGKFL